jgi:hypothetical protein
MFDSLYFLTFLFVAHFSLLKYMMLNSIPDPNPDAESRQAFEARSTYILFIHKTIEYKE